MREIKRARKMLQQAALKEFPNPDRIGCPPAETLEAMARRKRPTTEADLHHITHCSPCFGMFLAIRNVAKRRLVRATAALASAAVLIFSIYLAARFRTGHEATAVIAQWNLEHASPQRGAASQAQVIVEAPRKRGTVFIQLPLGSDDGQYDVEIRKDSIDAPPLKRFHGVAAIQNGHTNLPIQMDFSGLPAGRHYIAFRHADASWHFVPLVLH